MDKGLGKARGKHRERVLTDASIRKALLPGRYADGGGLYLEVEPSGSKRWTLRIVVNGRRRDIGLGGLGVVSLTDAREQARQLRAGARSGVDVLAARRKAREGVPTFQAIAEKVHAEHVGTWKNAKHAGQWINTLKTYAFPVIGDAPIDRIDQRDVLKVLGPIWTAKPETARRVKQRLNTVFDWAKAHGHRIGDNPVGGVKFGLAKQTDDAEHMAALSFDKMPEFVAALRASGADEITKLALEFQILTAARPGEARLAQWDEIDSGKMLRTIPGARMKAKSEHAVPLAPRAWEIVVRAAELRRNGNPLMFPARTGKPLSDATLAKLARSLGFGHVTAHGFRSTFRDWAAERTNFPSEVVEKSLAHAIANAVEAAYRRGALLDKRRELMTAWERFAVGQGSADVLPFRAPASA